MPCLVAVSVPCLVAVAVCLTLLFGAGTASASAYSGAPAEPTDVVAPARPTGTASGGPATAEGLATDVRRAHATSAFSPSVDASLRSGDSGCEDDDEPDAPRGAAMPCTDQPHAPDLRPAPLSQGPDEAPAALRATASTDTASVDLYRTLVIRT
ncbi:hypothetical protein [Streptomyces sp. NPDC059063]|uniref:hypothetical protein n=1 Tax=unclassified Streptomyces TaxID=2593676 RepID=UPI00367E96AF